MAHTNVAFMPQGSWAYTFVFTAVIGLSKQLYFSLGVLQVDSIRSSILE